jgi:hypothetical protein
MRQQGTYGRGGVRVAAGEEFLATEYGLAYKMIRDIVAAMNLEDQSLSTH